MDIEKEFNDWFYKSELAKVFKSNGDIVSLKYAFEIGAEKMKDDLYKRMFYAKEAE